MALAAVTHHSLMFSHRGSAEQDCCGKWEQLFGWKMKRDAFFFVLFFLNLMSYSFIFEDRRGKIGLGSKPRFNKGHFSRRGFASVIHLKYSSLSTKPRV